MMAPRLTAWSPFVHAPAAAFHVSKTRRCRKINSSSFTRVTTPPKSSLQAESLETPPKHPRGVRLSALLEAYHRLVIFFRYPTRTTMKHGHPHPRTIGVPDQEFSLQKLDSFFHRRLPPTPPKISLLSSVPSLCLQYQSSKNSSASSRLTITPILPLEIFPLIYLGSIKALDPPASPSPASTPLPKARPPLAMKSSLPPIRNSLLHSRR